MYQLRIPNSPTALRLGAEYLTKLAECADAIRDEARGSRVFGTLEVASPAVDAPVNPTWLSTFCSQCDSRQFETPSGVTCLSGHGGAAPRNAPDESDDNEKVFEVATPLVEQIAREVSAGDIYADDAGEGGPVEVTYEDPAPVAAGAPELVYHEGRAGYPLEAMRTAGWSDQALVDAGYAEWAPKPQASAPSAPVPPAPPAPPAPGTAPSENDSSASPSTGSVELDKAGLPWDERIHSSSRNLVADGTWRRKRGVDESLVQTVEAELRSIPKEAGAGAPTAPSAPIAPASAPVPPAATAPVSTFPELTQWLVAATRAGKISPTDVQLAIMGCGIEGINMLPHMSARPDLIPEVVGRLASKVGVA